MNDKNNLTARIIKCCYKVHSELGPGFNEKIYHNALQLMLKEENLKYEIEKHFDVYWQNQKVGSFIVDFIVQDEIILEIKAVEGNMPEIFKYQVISYLKASKLKIGLLVNFGNKSCYIKRIVF